MASRTGTEQKGKESLLKKIARCSCFLEGKHTMSVCLLKLPYRAPQTELLHWVKQQKSTHRSIVSSPKSKSLHTGFFLKATKRNLSWASVLGLKTAIISLNAFTQSFLCVHRSGYPNAFGSLLVILDRVSICSPHWPGSHFNIQKSSYFCLLSVGLAMCCHAWLQVFFWKAVKLD